MLVNASKSAGVYWRLFFRIVTFQWVTTDSNKKISFPLSASAQDVLTRRLRKMHSFLAGWLPSDPVDGRVIAPPSVFAKQLFGPCRLPDSARGKLGSRAPKRGQAIQ